MSIRHLLTHKNERKVVVTLSEFINSRIFGKKLHVRGGPKRATRHKLDKMCVRRDFSTDEHETYEIVVGK